MMKCACCGKRKKLFESFEDLGKGGKVCVDCSDILYRIHDAYTETNVELYDEWITTLYAYIKKGKSEKKFENWLEADFLKRNALKKPER